MTSAPPPRQSNAALYLALASSAFLLAVLGWKMMQPKSEPLIDDGSAFNVDAVPQDDDSAPATSYTSRFEREAARRMAGQGPGLAGFVPEAGKSYKASAAARQTGGDKSASPMGAVSARQRAREKQMWSKYKPVYDTWGAKMMGIARKYRKKYKVVKEIDRYFGGMPRFMALKKKHEAGDIDVYEFFRGITSLPEFRNGVRKYAGNPEAIKAGIQMTGEALATKPPKVLYRETFRTITEDNTITGFMSEEFWPKVTPRLPAALMSTEMPPGTSAADVQKVATDLSTSQVERVNRLQAEAQKNYRK